METVDIITIYKAGRNLELMHGLVMECNEQSIAIIKREDKRGIYYSINDTIDNVAQEVNHQECLMTLLMVNADRFKYPVYKTKISLFK